MTEFARLDLRPAYKTVFDALEGRIASGEFAVGQQLPTETTLSSQLGVNRSTVREGIRLLEEAGLVERREGRRLFVAVPRAADLATRASRAMILSRVTFRELWEVMMVLEPEAARLAAKGINDKAIERLRSNVDATRNAVKVRSSLVDLDNEFHSLVAEATGNRVLQLSRESIGPLLHDANDSMMPRVAQAGERLLTAHRGILEALEARDGEAAASWMSKHIADFKRGYALAGLDFNQPVPLPPRS
jgi:DNA-binding FadR family transcriptional regulator